MKKPVDSITRNHLCIHRYDVSMRINTNSVFGAETLERAGVAQSDKSHRISPLKGLLSLILAVGIVAVSVPGIFAFEAHVVNVTATIKNRECTMLRFETDASGGFILAGQKIDDEFEALGLTIMGESTRSGGTNALIAFDSSSPTGGDNDLGTPHQDFSGPGVGEGGAKGSEGENAIAQGNVLIIAEDINDEDGDGLVDDPDDEATGGAIRFIFDYPVVVHSMKVLDVEEFDTLIELRDPLYTPTHIATKSLGDNSIQTVQINQTNVKEIRVLMSGSGAVDDLCVAFPQNPTPEEGDGNEQEQGGDQGGGGGDGNEDNEDNDSEEDGQGEDGDDENQNNASTTLAQEINDAVFAEIENNISDGSASSTISDVFDAVDDVLNNRQHSSTTESESLIDYLASTTSTTATTTEEVLGSTATSSEEVVEDDNFLEEIELVEGVDIEEGHASVPGEVTESASTTVAIQSEEGGDDANIMIEADSNEEVGLDEVGIQIEQEESTEELELEQSNNDSKLEEEEEELDQSDTNDQGDASSADTVFYPELQNSTSTYL